MPDQVGMQSKAGRTSRLQKESAYEALRDLLVKVQIAPGEQLYEQALAEDIASGVAAIREAVRRLAFEQLVQVVPRGGTFAAPIGLRESQSLMEVRLGIEALAVELAAARGSAAEKARLCELADRQHRSDVLQECIDLDAEFHRSVYEMSRNQYLQATANVHFNLALRLWYFCSRHVATPEWGEVDHRALAAAVSSGDTATAREQMTEHVRHDSQQVVDILTQHGF